MAYNLKQSLRTETIYNMAGQHGALEESRPICGLRLPKYFQQNNL